MVQVGTPVPKKSWSWAQIGPPDGWLVRLGPNRRNRPTACPGQSRNLPPTTKRGPDVTAASAFGDRHERQPRVTVTRLVDPGEAPVQEPRPPSTSSPQHHTTYG